MKKFETDCSQCGNVHHPLDLSDLKCPQCGGPSRRVYQLAETTQELQDALLDRAVDSNGVRPLLKFRPSKGVTLIEDPTPEQIAFSPSSLRMDRNPFR